MAGWHEGSKSLVAAPLWAVKYHVHLGVFYLIPCPIEITQTLHQQGFAPLVPARTSLSKMG